MRLSVAFAAALLSALVAAPQLGAQMVSIPFGGPKHPRPSTALTLRGSPPDIAAAIAAKDRPPAMTNLDPSRRPAEVLKFLDLPLGARVLDVMAGAGYYSEIIGGAIGPGGTVTALVPPATMKDPARRAVISGVVGRVPNVAILAASPATVQFAANSFDFILMHLVYHDLYGQGAGRVDPAAFLGKIYAAVRPGGIVGVIDHVARPGGDTGAVATTLHRIDPATVKADFARAGFVFDDASDLLAVPGDDHAAAVFDPAVRGGTDRFVFRFRKPE
ncbi:MAG: methyltransferase domain-containing protein [Janthinobacterium lividum]